MLLALYLSSSSFLQSYSHMFIKWHRECENMETIILKYELVGSVAKIFVGYLKYSCTLWFMGLREQQKPLGR